MIVIVPPFQSPDEQTHLYRAYQLSEGGVIAKQLSYGAGDILPASLSQSFNSYSFLMFNPEAKTNTGILKESILLPISSNDEVETRFENTAVYPPAAYAPQILAIWVGNIFSAGPVILLYMARLFNLVAWVFILRLIMKRTPRIALPIFAFALLPIVAFQASSASADVMTTAISIAFVGEIIRQVWTRSAMTNRNVYVLIGLSLLLALCKFPYVLLVGLILLIPNGKFKSVRSAWKAKILTTAPALVLSGLWLIVGQRTFVNLRAGTDSGAQLSGILADPAAYAHVLFTTYFTTGSDLLYIQMLGQLGWLDTKLPLWGLMCALIAVALSVIALPKVSEKMLLSKLQYGFIVAVFAALLLAISSALYLTWNAPNAPIIDGLQGRYYLPLYGVVVLLFSGLLGLTQNQFKSIRRLVYALCSLSIISTLITLIVRYYAIS